MLSKKSPAVTSLIQRLFVAALILCGNQSYAQLKVDGVLTTQEWGMAIKTSSLSFDFGYFYYAVQSDTLFFAFDIIADNMDNDPAQNKRTDMVEIYIDVNGNNLRDSQDYVFRANSLQKNGGLIRSCGSCKAAPNNQSNGIYATEMGISPVFKGYSHRTWEIAIPSRALPAKAKTGFAFRITSAYPQFSTLVLMDKTDLAYESVLIWHDSTIRIAIQKNVSPPQSNGDNSTLVTGRRILNDGSVETSYADNHKRIDFAGGFTIISPDGRKSTASYMSVPKYVPPTMPDANINKWLDNLNASLLSLISEWVDHDQASLTNMTAGESGKNIFDIINRRCSVIDYLNPLKK